MALVDEARESFPPLPEPSIESQPDLQDLVLAPVDELKSASDDCDGNFNVTFDIDVAVVSVVASAPAAAATRPPTAAAAPSVVVVPPAVSGDFGPTDTCLETECDVCQGDPADPEVQTNFECEPS